jgi:hypothetical protein
MEKRKQTLLYEEVEALQGEGQGVPAILDEDPEEQRVLEVNQINRMK